MGCYPEYVTLFVVLGQAWDCLHTSSISVEPKLPRCGAGFTCLYLKTAGVSVVLSLLLLLCVPLLHKQLGIVNWVVIYMTQQSILTSRDFSMQPLQLQDV